MADNKNSNNTIKIKILSGAIIPDNEYNKHKKTAGCWRLSIPSVLGDQIAPAAQESELAKLMNNVQTAIDKDEYKNRIFEVEVKPLPPLSYVLEYVSNGPDFSFIVTLSVGFKNVLTKSPCNPDEMDPELFSPELCHRVVGDHNIGRGIQLCLSKYFTFKESLSNESCDNNQSTTSDPLESLNIEFAPNHPAAYFAPSDADYCGWESGNKGFSQQSMYKLVYSNGLKTVFISEATCKLVGNISCSRSGTINGGDVMFFTNEQIIFPREGNILKLKNVLLTFSKLTRGKGPKSLIFADASIIFVGIHTNEIFGRKDGAIVNSSGSNCEQQGSYYFYENLSLGTKLILESVVINDDQNELKKDSGAIHFLTCKSHLRHEGLSETFHSDAHCFDLTKSHILSTNADDLPLVAVAWNKNETQTDAVIIYNLVTQQIWGRIDLHHIGAQYKVSSLSSLFSFHGATHLILGIEKFTKEEVIGNIVLVDTATLKIDLSHTSKPTKKCWADILCTLKPVHTNRISCICVQNTTIYIGSYDKTFSILKLDHDLSNWQMFESPMDATIANAQTHVDIILSVIPISEGRLFTTSWDTTIRYWEKLGSFWMSYRFPIEHTKKVSCIAYFNLCQHSGAKDHLEKHILFVQPSDAKRSKVVSEIVVTGGLDSFIIVWDVLDPRKPLVVRYLRGHKDEVIDVKIMDYLSMPLVLSASKDKTIRLWDILSGECIRELTHITHIHAMTFARIWHDPSSSTDNRRDLSSSTNNICCPWSSTDNGSDTSNSTDNKRFLGDIILSTTSEAVVVWNFVSNPRHSVEYSDPVISLANISLFSEDNIGVAAVMSRSTSVHQGTIKRLTLLRENTVKRVQLKAIYDLCVNSSKSLICHINLIGTSNSSIIFSINSKKSMELKVGVKTIKSLLIEKDSSSVKHTKEKANRTKEKENRVRVNAMVVYDSVTQIPKAGGKHELIDHHTHYILAGLADGVCSIVKQDNSSPPEFEEVAYFKTKMSNIFSLAILDKDQQLENSLHHQDNSLLFIGGMPDNEGNSVQIWNLTELLSTIDNKCSRDTELKHDDIELKQGDTEWTQWKLPFNGSHKRPSVRSIAVHYLKNDPNIFITGDYKPEIILWKILNTDVSQKRDDAAPNNVVGFEKLCSLSGLHQNQFIINLAVFSPIEKWISGKGTEDKFEFRWTIKNENGEKEEYDLKNHFVVISGGYDGKIGFWPIPFTADSSHDDEVSGDKQQSETSQDCTDLRPEASSLSCSGVSVEDDSPTRRTNDKRFARLPPKSNSENSVCIENDVMNKLPQLRSEFLSLEHSGLQSVTAMAVYFPQGGVTIKPLLFTGSIDNLIYVWDIYEQQKLRVLTGHSNRINALMTYFQDSEAHCHVLVSGSDDCSTVIWHDGLQHHSYPPPKQTLIRSFYSDIATPGNWQQIKALKKVYPMLFMELPHLFYLALIERQESFFVEFLEDLKMVVNRIPGYPRSERKEKEDHAFYHSATGDVDILEYAMHINALVALRGILLAWSHVLNKDIGDSLNQNVLLTTHKFNEKNLFELAIKFPVEYTEFLVSIRLVRCHSSVETVCGNLIRVIPDGKRYIVVGSNSFPLGENFRKRSGFVHDLLYAIYEAFMDFKIKVFRGHKISEQAVIPLMIPIKRFVDLRQFQCAIQTAEILKRLDLFESDIMLSSINHYWNVHGWMIYMINLIQYAFTVFLFVVSIYTYQHLAEENNLEQYNNSVRKAQAANAGFVVFMAWFGLDEIFQFISKYGKFQKHRASGSRFLYILMNHFVFDLWNVIDWTVVVTGLMGAYIRFRELRVCYHAGECDRNSTMSATSSCLLAATAVMLWIKVLYFLRPVKAAGQFVVMVMVIVSDIKYFIFVLLCVLIGFAQGFWLLLSDSDAHSQFSDIRQSYFTTFMFMFGQIETSDLHNGKSSSFAKLYLVVFMMTMMILLFNLLIALMGDSFSRTKEKIEAHYWKELANFMVDQSMFTPLLAFLHWIKWIRYKKDDFIHVVKYASDWRKSHRSLSRDEFGGDDDDDGYGSSSDDESVIANSNDETADTSRKMKFPKRLTALERAFHLCKDILHGDHQRGATTSGFDAVQLSKKATIDADIIRRCARKRDVNVKASRRRSSVDITSANGRADNNVSNESIVNDGACAVEGLSLSTTDVGDIIMTVFRDPSNATDPVVPRENTIDGYSNLTISRHGSSSIDPTMGDPTIYPTDPSDVSMTRNPAVLSDHTEEVVRRTMNQNKV